MPIIYAHRGGAALRPENTIAAFDHGLACGAGGLELDVHLSRDGVVIVHHDDTLERTTDARGRVSDRTAAELARVDAGFQWTDGRGNFPFRGQGIGIPTLAEVLRRYPATPVIIELKRGGTVLGERVAETVRAASAADRVAVGSYHADAICAVRRSAPEIPTGAIKEEIRWALYRSWVGLPLRSVPYRQFQVPERSGLTRIVSRRFVAHAHRAGLAVHVWTVDHEDDMRRLAAWGVDGLITDRPDLARSVIGSSAPS